MVLGLKTKNRTNTVVQLDYLIHVQEIKPWPPSQSLRTLRSVLIQWENGDRSSGSTNSVVPSHGSVIGEGKIEFNESFRLPVTLLRDMSIKAVDADTFQKNCLEFNLYELRRDNSVKGQLLGSAIIDLADYGVVKETLNTSIPMNCKRSFSNMAAPVLSIKIQPVDKGRTSSSSRDSLSKEESLEKNGGESVSALINEEYAEEAELASLTDDDVSSHSSVIISSTALESNEGLPRQKGANGPDTVTDSTGSNKKGGALTSKMGVENSDIMPMKASSLFSSSSLNLSSDLRSPVNGRALISSSPVSSPVLMAKDVVTHSFHSFTLSSSTYEYEDEESNPSVRSNGREDLAQEVHEKLTNGGTAIGGGTQQSSKENKPNSSSAKEASPDSYPQVVEKGSTNSVGCLVDGEDVEKAWRTGGKCMEKLPTTDDICNSSMGDKDRKKQQEHGQNLEEKSHSAENELVNSQVFMCSDTVSLGRGNLGMNGNIVKSDRLKHVKSVRSPLDSARNNGLVSSNQNIELKEACVPGNSQNNAGSLRSNERKDAKVYPDTRCAILDCKIQQLEHKINMLEGELREAAAIEAALYSIVAEHGSSMSKVHAPARRLSRLYLHACKESSQSRRASAARSAVSGLVLVAKACGNDVPRLTFWLSNSVVLRVVISQTIGVLPPLSAGPPIERNGGGKGYNKRSSPLKWKEFSSSQKENKNILYGSFGDWEDPHTFTSALEKVEAWIFSRIVESIWWQTLTPHMQSAAANTIDRVVDSGSGKNYGRSSSSCEQDQDYFSLDLWRKAFKDACERLCPVRAGGHECGCLPVLAKLIMEQCVSRLDVAMFNAILRESADEIPTDPVSDPISDSKVLPIPAGKSSFGAGAQLKNVIGNWSRWLTDLFGMDDGNSLEDENELDGTDERQYTSFKLFHLLNALSDLMMLPKDMLLSRSIRKEVCPTFGATLIKRVLDNFVPDEFCPDPIPDVVLEALDSEDPLGAEESSVTDFPCVAASTVYSPPSAASFTGIVGEVGSQSQLRRTGSSVLKKSYSSDDELDELYSPLASIFIDGSQSSPVSAKPSWISKEDGNQNAFSFRYELLRDVWMNDM